MKRALAAVFALLLATTVFADRDRASRVSEQNLPQAQQPVQPFRISGSSVTGFVSGVNGNLISLADGLITIDASQASILGDRGETVPPSSIQRGALILATLDIRNDDPANAPLRARTIAVLRTSAVTLTGEIRAIDLSAGTLQVNGRTIYVTRDTGFGGFGPDKILRTLADLVVGQTVAVSLDNVGGKLTASFIQLLFNAPQRLTTLHGTVKSIAVDSWTLDVRGKETTVVVTSRTAIIGEPKVGDQVEVVAQIDSSNRYVAVSILRSPVVVVPGNVQRIRGNVVSISSTKWVVKEVAANYTQSGKEYTLTVGLHSKITSGIKVGDLVDVVASVDSQTRELTILTITPALQLPGIGGIGGPLVGMPVTGRVQEIAGDVWTISTFATIGGNGSEQVKVKVNSSTEYVDSPKVGDNVMVVTQKSGGDLIALVIARLPF